jgi:hypothetical protein
MSQRADDLGRSATPPPYTDEDLGSFGDDPLIDTPARKGIDPLEAVDTFGDADEIAVTRDQIEQTRAEMSETIDAIQERLDPQLLVDQAKDAARDAALEKVQDLKSNVRQATVGKVEDAVSSVSEKVQGIVGVTSDRTGDASDTAARTMNGSKQAGHSLLDTVKQHPVPAAMAGIGLGWLFYSTRQDNKPQQDVYYQPTYTPQAYDQRADQNQRSDGTASSARLASKVQDSAGQLAGQASDRVAQAANSTSQSVSQIGTKASSTARRSADSLGDLVQRNPLAVGAVTVGLGMLAGLAVPETEQENQMLGPAHDAVMERAGQMAQEKSRQAQNAAREAVHTAKQEEWNQDLLPGS